MKKLARLLSLSLTAGVLLSACQVDPEEVDEEFPGLEEPADDGIDDDLDTDTDTNG